MIEWQLDMPCVWRFFLRWLGGDKMTIGEWIPSQAMAWDREGANACDQASGRFGAGKLWHDRVRGYPLKGPLEWKLRSGIRHRSEDGFSEHGFDCVRFFGGASPDLRSLFLLYPLVVYFLIMIGWVTGGQFAWTCLNGGLLQGDARLFRAAEVLTIRDGVPISCNIMKKQPAYKRAILQNRFTATVILYFFDIFHGILLC